MFLKSQKLNFLAFCSLQLIRCAVVRNDRNVNFFIESSESEDRQNYELTNKLDENLNEVQLVQNYSQLRKPIGNGEIHQNAGIDRTACFLSTPKLRAASLSKNANLNPIEDTFVNAKKNTQKNTCNLKGQAATSESVFFNFTTQQVKRAVEIYFNLQRDFLPDEWKVLGYRYSRVSQRLRSMYVLLKINKRNVFCKFTAMALDYGCESMALQTITSRSISGTYALVATFRTGVTMLPFAIMTDLIGQPNLFDFFSEENHLQPDKFVRIMRNLAGAIHEIHSKGLVHRDIKLENVLVHRGVQTVYLVDFGHSCAIKSLSDTMAGVWGTAYAAAPEVLSGTDEFTCKCDWYSYGACLFYGYLVGTNRNSKQQIPYEEISLNEESVTKYIPSPSLRSLIIKLIQPEARRLADYDEILAEPFFLRFPNE